MHHAIALLPATLLLLYTRFDGIHESAQLFDRHGLREVVSEDWTSATLPSWREEVLVTLRDMYGLVWSDMNNLYITAIVAILVQWEIQISNCGQYHSIIEV